ncbi:hypothetical protein KQX54_007329 [Cotesia glomerata]|uniref:Uncharacterized protein n=1 Tax=Cotesia glomerata TaxID=32391 RepID=A0AAV7J6C5_COTGL|nr:hypothetical protein KQX54_007329 [Cotesia glomerata]
MFKRRKKIFDIRYNVATKYEYLRFIQSKSKSLTDIDEYIHALCQGSVSGNDVHLLWMDKSQHFPIVKHKMTRQQILVSSRIL